jgi:hypothetical protein
MQAKTGVQDELSGTPLDYEPPQVIEIGDVVELTKGATENDTADRNNYYF